MGRFPEDLIPGGKVVFWTKGKTIGEVEPEFAEQGRGLDATLRIGGRKVQGVVREVLGINEEGDVTGVRIDVDDEIMPGSIGMWDLPEAESRDGQFWARACDDVAGAASLVCLLDELVRDKAANPVTCVFTRAEEGGFFGAVEYCVDHYGGDATPDQAGPEVMISVECSKAFPHAPLGDGPIVRVGDRHVMFDPELTVWASRCARRLTEREETFTFQRKLMDGGTCESSVFQAWMGRAGALCVALGNYHNFDPEKKTIELETIDIGDWGNLIRLMREMVDSSGESETQPGSSFGEFKNWCVEWTGKHRHLYADAAGTA
jgi:endoglucanase